MIGQDDRDRLEDLGLHPGGDHTEDLRPTKEIAAGPRQRTDGDVHIPAYRDWNYR